MPVAGITDDRFALVLRPDLGNDVASVTALMRRFRPVTVEEHDS
jgi:hypothetical protein